MTITTWAESAARGQLETQLPRRWAHTRGVTATAGTIAGILGPDGDLVTAAAWLHDIGYSRALAVTGFHPSTAPGGCARCAALASCCAAW